MQFAKVRTTPPHSAALTVCVLGTVIGGGLLHSADETCSEPEFAHQIEIADVPWPSGLAVADLDNDNVPDLLAANNLGDTISIFFGAGDGGFGPRQVVQTVRQPVALAVADFDRDGHLDLAVTSIAADMISIHLGRGSGLFVQGELMPIEDPGEPTSADVDKDGELDIAVANLFDSSVSILLGRGDGSFLSPLVSSVGTYPYFIGVGDLNNDGELDLAVPNRHDVTVSILMGLGDGSFSPQMLVDVPGRNDVQDIALADFDKDGHLDMVVVNAFINHFGEGGVASYRGNGDGSFGSPDVLLMGDRPTQIGVADFDGDRNLDLAVTNADGGTVSVLPGHGDGSFGPEFLLDTFPGSSSIVAQDLNGDASPDIAVANHRWNNLSILLNTCPFAYQMPSFVVGGARCRFEAPGQDSFVFVTEYELAAASDGIDPENEPVVVSYGTATIVLPPDSFECMGSVCRYESDGTGITRAVLTEASLAFEARGIDLSGTPNTPEVSVEIGNDRGDGRVRLKGTLGQSFDPFASSLGTFPQILPR